VIASTSAGVCTNTGKPCVQDAPDCAPGGTCFVPPGGCILDLATSCVPSEEELACPTGEFCQPISGEADHGTCRKLLGPCLKDANDGACPPPAECNEGDQNFLRLAGPLTDQGGSAVFTGSGRCVEDRGTPCPCASGPCDACEAGEFCENATCHRESGACLNTANCAPGAVCRQDLITQGVIDSDGDELPDVIDNCPNVPNITQADTDGDHVGDACECALLADPKAKIRTHLKGTPGRLDAMLTLPLDSYVDDSLRVSLRNEAGTMVEQSLGTLERVGHSQKSWRFASKLDGVTLLTLQNLAPRHPRQFRIKIKSRRWFTTELAAKSSVLSVTIGNQCFAHAITRRQ
jgi:hypothetical protein